ncbi:aldehyde dehydrogenase family protein [Candidatus Enterococcus ikei]|uniref:Aldehyde dehydrogenase n=1 Tax=Candidatus Enterococcus ikei TaxID=2815326 RepID=A0ABS3H111_9ENTE|nr:aldehyde dehydrogenase family protein [Enterococcus sp. DIV0869a]MBO0440849.1 aldehyde dehydrogenase family protein [Enterococcus sp. DIV0869a]
MNQSDFQMILKKQRNFFNSNQTKSISFRKEQLEKLLVNVKKHEEDFYWAFEKDLKKPKAEVYATEFGLVLSAIKDMLKNLDKWTKPINKPRAISSLLNKNTVFLEPYGTVYIIGPFNYPLQLTLVPLVGSLAAGNCAIVKPSSRTPNVAAVIGAILGETFNEEYVKVLSPNSIDNATVLKERMDFIFFTGSTKVGKIVMEAAAKHLTPVVLELGGKSPAIVTEQADIELAAERIIWSKLLNTGQTCIATDYVLVDEKVKNQLIVTLKEKITEFYGKSIQDNPDYGRIVQGSAIDKFIQLIDENRQFLIHGGEYDRETRFVAPSLFNIDLSRENSLMQEELFGPLLPICTYQQLDDAISFVKAGEKPLALYLFSDDREVQKQILHEISFGGGGINQTILHVANDDLPFGGVGFSGMGNYHGKYSIKTFSHEKAIVYGRKDSMAKLIYPPYDQKKFEWLKRLL